MAACSVNEITVNAMQTEAKMAGRDLISLADFTPAEILATLELAEATAPDLRP